MNTPVTVERTTNGLKVTGRVAMSDMKRFVLSLPGPEDGTRNLKADFKTGKLSRWSDGHCGFNMQVGFYSLQHSPEPSNYTWSWGQKTLRRLQAFAKRSEMSNAALRVYVSVLWDTHSQLVEDDYNSEWVDRVLTYYRNSGDSVEEPMD
jgi:hypothetical protein